MSITRFLVGMLWAGLVVLGAGVAPGQDYPNKPIRMVQSSPPGGSSDALSREVASRLSTRLGQTVVVDNRPGGGGVIGTEIVARALPDGYTLLFTGTHHSVLPSLHEKLPYDAVADFAPVSAVAFTTSILVVHPALPVKTVKELLALARAKPGQLNYSAGTTGATAHLGAELLKTMAGVNIVHIPYKGGAAQLTACSPAKCKCHLPRCLQPCRIFAAAGYVPSLLPASRVPLFCPKSLP